MARNWIGIEKQNMARNWIEIEKQKEIPPIHGASPMTRHVIQKKIARTDV